MSAIVDLIYAKFGDHREMSCAVTGDGKDKLLGPLIGEEAIKLLAPLLQRHLPHMFGEVKAAELYLTMVHLRNLSRHRNTAGQDYPLIITKDVR